MTLFSRKRASSLALAIALATGSAVVATAVFPAEANAQRTRDNEKKDERKERSSGSAVYSKEFRAAFTPLEEAIKDQTADFTGRVEEIKALAALMNTPDEQLAGGNLVYNAGIRAGSPELQLTGMQAMLASGKVAPESLGRFNFITFQLYNQMGDFATARTYLQAAIDANFTSGSVTASGLQITMAENYFAAGEIEGGLAYLANAIAARKAQGQPVEENWYRRGVTVAYENETTPQVYDMVTMWIADYPATGNWSDAINIARNLNNFEPGALLDLFRLSRKVGALSEPSDYDYYIEVADARRLPQEVKSLIEEGIDAGAVAESNLYAAEALAEAKSRIAADRADLPELERDASAANAPLITVTAAGDTFLSYGQYGKAAGFFERALGMPGVDTNEVLTRLGIAQIENGDYAAARASFAKVTGVRAPLAKLWSAYAAQQEPATDAMATDAPAETM